MCDFVSLYIVELCDTELKHMAMFNLKAKPVELSLTLFGHYV